MIEEFITTTLLLVLGYAYPAFQCFKTVDKNRVDISELRFWCQYWIVVAVITVLEKIGDVFIAWLPMYGELKLALFIFLWFPETRGTGYIYEKLLQPYMSRHESDIDRSLIELREKAWNLTVYYWNNCTELGSTKILDFLHFVGSHTSTTTTASHPITNSQDDPMNHQPADEAPPASPQTQSPTVPSSSSSGMFGRSEPDRRRPPAPFARYRNQTPKVESLKVELLLPKQKVYVRPEDVLIQDYSK
ncbi:putative HVA22-like protein g [Andrographis paniculata]|uniref:putative HVA22-like protein g n=1 Tax=Andrographis paniculata TaxID=175694 RepID=UPI0021E7ECE7|nr:putative HVA22-like protein g [Andrographis paniculata]XP_051150513.1 putative HVA22-like protein g [Andrographis paniculata]XP_051150514.1 putative HVA22-like protein g [Andrographis paniculata]